MSYGPLARGAAHNRHDIVRCHAGRLIDDEKIHERKPFTQPRRPARVDQRERNSLRVCSCVLNTPRIELVTVDAFCFSTPRIIMQR